MQSLIYNYSSVEIGENLVNIQANLNLSTSLYFYFIMYILHILKRLISERRYLSNLRNITIITTFCTKHFDVTFHAHIC